jgi:hypothetical protein
MNPCLNCNDRCDGPVATFLRLICTAFILGGFLVGCSGGRDGGADTRDGAASQIHSMADIERWLTPVGTTNDIVRSLGRPHRVEDLSGGDKVWRYGLSPFPAEGQMRGAMVVGLVIGITNGHLAYWTCAYAGAGEKVPKEDLPTPAENIAAKATTQDSPTVKFFVVTSQPTTNGRFVDTERFPKLGFVSPSPNLVVGKLKGVVVEQRGPSAPETGGRTVWSFTIQLTAEDATQLASLTATNILKQILVMVCDEAVSAPTIRAPLETGSLVIECTDGPHVEAIKRQLAKMERP